MIGALRGIKDGKRRSRQIAIINRLNLELPKNFGSKQANKPLNHWQLHENGTVAQSVEQRTFNPLVASSNLARPTNIQKALKAKCF